MGLCPLGGKVGSRCHGGHLPSGQRGRQAAPPAPLSPLPRHRADDTALGGPLPAAGPSPPLGCRACLGAGAGHGGAPRPPALHFPACRARRGRAGPRGAERQRAAPALVLPGAGRGGRAGVIGGSPMERGKMAELESLETAAEHERILREIESTDTACIGPTLRCGRGGAAAGPGAAKPGRGRGVARAGFALPLPSTETLKK